MTDIRRMMKINSTVHPADIREKNGSFTSHYFCNYQQYHYNPNFFTVVKMLLTYFFHTWNVVGTLAICCRYVAGKQKLMLKIEGKSGPLRQVLFL